MIASIRRSLLLFALLTVCLPALALAEEKAAAAEATADSAAAEPTSDQVKAETNGTGSSSSGGDSSEGEKKPKYPPHAEVLKEFETIDGLVPLYLKDGTLYAELKSEHLNKDFIVLTSIARGIGEGALLAGMTWGFGDDWLWQFRKVDDNIQVVRRNVRFRAAEGSPEQRAVELAYTDSVLFSLPIKTIGPRGGMLVDFSEIFFTDLPQISRALPGFAFSTSKSSWAEVKGFKDNIELQVAATYSSSGTRDFDTVPDSRGVSINIHYSISLLPQTGYKPRLADDRVGYFLTALKDFSSDVGEDRFVRFVNRWDLQKADPKAELSPPKTPIIFWIERTVPYAYRKPIREGILEWNRAFEQAGFLNAIEVRQQPDDAEWDPEDINYNTFRWITAGAAFAMGPSRVNPTTGQILDADIIFDADFVQFWKDEFEIFSPESIAAMTGGPLDLESYRALMGDAHHEGHDPLCACTLQHGMSRQLALGSTALLARLSAEELEDAQHELIMQAIKEVAMHEVGHTLGLRHNFKASSMVSLEDLHNKEKTRETGLAASVMDYLPTNIAAQGDEQGYYYSPTIGPYDIWAIEYGYKPLSASSPEAEKEKLNEIASRGAQPGLSFATDEDTRGIDPDPLVNRFDLGDNPLEYARQRSAVVQELLPSVVEKVTEEGEGYQRARQAFGILLSERGMAVFMAARTIGGLYVNRDHKGDPNARPPYVVVDAATQREAMKLLEEEIFSDKPFDFPPELYNHLASTRWNHWGMRFPERSDYAVHDVVAQWQSRVLDQLLSSLTLARLHDSELRVKDNVEAFTTAELLERLTGAVFAEVDSLEPGAYSDREPAISSLRRNLQRIYLKRLAEMALGQTRAPEDCQTVAYLQLVDLEGQISALLAPAGGKKNQIQLDTYSRAHLLETRDRIKKVLDARLTFSQP